MAELQRFNPSRGIPAGRLRSERFMSETDRRSDCSSSPDVAWGCSCASVSTPCFCVRRARTIARAAAITSWSSTEAHLLESFEGNTFTVSAEEARLTLLWLRGEDGGENSVRNWYSVRHSFDEPIRLVSKAPLHRLPHRAGGDLDLKPATFQKEENVSLSVSTEDFSPSIHFLVRNPALTVLRAEFADSGLRNDSRTSPFPQNFPQPPQITIYCCNCRESGQENISPWSGQHICDDMHTVATQDCWNPYLTCGFLNRNVSKHYVYQDKAIQPRDWHAQD